MDHRAKNMDLAGRKSFGQKVATASYYDCATVRFTTVVEAEGASAGSGLAVMGRY